MQPQIAVSCVSIRFDSHSDSDSDTDTDSDADSDFQRDSSVFPHTNSQCVQYHNCSYYSLAFDSSVCCCCCCWWQMTFHYACGTCADFVITLNKSQILPALAEGDPMSMSLGWKICRTIVGVSFNQSLLLLSSNWPCDFNWKANWTYCLLREGIDRTGPMQVRPHLLRLCKPSSWRGWNSVSNTSIYFHISSAGIHDSRGINVLSLSVIELKCNIIEICKMLPDAFVRCKFKHICDSHIIRNCNKRRGAEGGGILSASETGIRLRHTIDNGNGQSCFPSCTHCVCVYSKYSIWRLAWRVCVCACPTTLTSLFFIVFCAQLLLSISSPPRFVSVYLFYRLWSNFPLHTFSFFF